MRRAGRPAYQERWSITLRDSPGRIVNGSATVAPGDGSPSAGAGRSRAAPSSTSRPALVSGAHQPPRNPARVGFAPSSRTGAASSQDSQGRSGGPAPQRTKPPGSARAPWGFRPVGRKFRALKEKTASSGSVAALLKVYSKAATGRLEASASPGSNGLHASISTWSGSRSSESATVAKGKRTRKAARPQRGSP